MLSLQVHSERLGIPDQATSHAHGAGLSRHVARNSMLLYKYPSFNCRQSLAHCSQEGGGTRHNKLQPVQYMRKRLIHPQAVGVSLQKVP